MNKLDLMAGTVALEGCGQLLIYILIISTVLHFCQCNRASADQ